jgi:hypothetical protein
MHYIHAFINNPYPAIPPAIAVYNTLRLGSFFEIAPFFNDFCDDLEEKRCWLMYDTVEAVTTTFLLEKQLSGRGDRDLSKDEKSQYILRATIITTSIFAVAFLAVQGMNRYLTPQVDLTAALASCSELPKEALTQMSLSWKGDLTKNLMQSLFLTRIVLNITFALYSSGTQRICALWNIIMQGGSLYQLSIPVLEVHRYHETFSPFIYGFKLTGPANPSNICSVVAGAFEESNKEINYINELIASYTPS